jgi:uncharacterized protein YbcI
MLTDIKESSTRVARNSLSQQKKIVTDYTQGEALAQEFLTAWQQAHGAPHGAASALVGPDSLAVLLEKAFSRAEHNLSRQRDTAPLLEQYIHRLIDQIAPNVAGRVEQVTGRQVLTTSLNADVKQDWVIIFFKLGDVLEPAKAR